MKYFIINQVELKRHYENNTHEKRRYYENNAYKEKRYHDKDTTKKIRTRKIERKMHKLASLHIRKDAV